MPEEGAGLVREVGYSEVPLGIYDSRLHPSELFEPVPCPIPVQIWSRIPIISVMLPRCGENMHDILHEFEESLHTWQMADPDFNEAYGILTVSQEQPQLKRLNWEIFWQDAAGVDNTFERHFFLHEDSMYWEEYGFKDFRFLTDTAEEQ